MKDIIIIAIIAFNIFSIILTWKMLKGFDLKKKIILLILNEIINAILLLIIYAFSANNIPKEIHKQAKMMILSTILPINVMISATTILNLVNKLTFKEIKDEKFNQNIKISIIVIFIILIIETIYIHNIQLEIGALSK